MALSSQARTQGSARYTMVHMVGEVTLRKGCEQGGTVWVRGGGVGRGAFVP